MERKKEVGLVSCQGQGGGAKPKLSKQQKQELKAYLKSTSAFYTLGQVRSLILERYGVNYSKRQVQRLARGLGMYCYKPQPRDYRQPENAAYKLKEKLRAVADVLGMRGKDVPGLCR